MIRNIKVLGLAVMAAMAIGAFAASAALATPEFTAEVYPATIHGSNTKGTEVFETEGGKVECDASYHATLPEASSTLNVVPNYTNCDAFGFLEAEVNEEGCSYLFHATEKTAADKYNIHADVVCPAGQSIKISVFTCAAEVKAQTGLTTVEITNDTSASPKKDVTVKANVLAKKTNVEGGIAYTVTQDGIFCPFSGKGNKVGGQYTGEATTATGLTDPTQTEKEMGVSQVPNGIEISGE
jgi:hypothetical protein